MLTVTMLILTGCIAQKAKETKIIAHRGAHIVAPENTVEAIEKANDLGYSGVEIDVRTSKDGINFLMHDDTLDRTTNGSGEEEKLTIKELKDLEIKTAGYPDYKNEVLKIPTFEEAVESIAKTKLEVNIDGSKGNWADEKFVYSIMQTLKKYKVYNRSFFVLSDKKIRDSVVKCYPDATVSWLYDSKNNIDDEIKQVKSYEKSLLSISNSQADKEMLNKLNQAQINYQVYGVNDNERFLELQKQSVPIIETDKIDPTKVN
ncbi:glycerophosphodiester phosphodiesterase [Enterococcus termitis]|nr:glycerophosphodiester phosphodiesterase family protein [Enterococcus termitis]